MSDYLNLDSDDTPFEGGNSYLLDDPEPPTAPPPPPVPGNAMPHQEAPADDFGGNDWLSGGDDPAMTADHDLSAGFSLDPPANPPMTGDWLGDSPSEPSISLGQPVGYDTPPSPAQIMDTVQHSGSLTIQPPMLDEVAPHASLGGARSDLTNLVLDVEVPVEVCFGDAALTVEEFLEMNQGSVVELEHAIDAPIELRVRGKLVARGQLVTINGNYGMRIIEMIENRA